MVERAEKEGYEEGKRGKQGGILGALQSAAKGASKHVEIGPKKGGEGFGLGFAEPRASDFDLGLGMRRGKKKRDAYSELGL